MTNNLILRYILEIAMIIPAVVFTVLPVIEYLHFKSVKAFLTGVVLLIAFVALGVFIRAKFMLSSMFIMIPYAVLFFILYIMLVNTSSGRKLFCFFNSVMLCMFCPLYTVFLMAPVEAKKDIWYETELFTLKSGTTCLVLAVLIGAIFFKTLYIKLPMLMKQEYIGTVWDILFLVPMFMSVLIWWSIPLHPDLAMVGRLRPAALIFLWLILMMTLLLYHVFWWTAEKITEGAKLQQENTLLSIESKRYEELRNYMDKTRALRHDFRHHILVITQLSNSGNFNELQNYLLQFNEGMENIYTGYCNNIAVDAIASYYTSYAESQGIKINWKLNLPYNLPLNESEYCAVLGNLIENALNAVKNLSEDLRYVKVISSLLSKSILGISIDNPYSGKIKFGRNGLPKSDREGHGVGLVSVMNTVRRYEGSMDIKVKGKIFSVDIILYCN